MPNDCEAKYSVVDSAKCLSEAEYANLAHIKGSFPGAKHTLRTHSRIHDCDHGNCRAGENHSVMVRVKVGPFSLQREYAL